MLINDNHNWYLLIAKDEKSGIAERKIHTFAHVCDYRVGVSLSLHVEAISDTGVILINQWWSLMEPTVC